MTAERKRAASRSTIGSRKPTRGRPDRRATSRVFAVVLGGVCGFVGVSGSAVAHGGAGHGEGTIPFIVVVGGPVAIGLAAGVIVCQGRWRLSRVGGAWFTSLAGLGLVGLGATLALAAIGEGDGLAIGGLGVLVALLFARHGGSVGTRGHADLTLGAVSIHRLVEGVALGALYSSGVLVGLLATLVIAGHAAVETAAVSGLYHKYWVQAVAAAVLVQVGYVIGALIGFGVVDVVPPAIQGSASALAGGLLVGIGADLTFHAAAGEHPHGFG